MGAQSTNSGVSGLRDNDQAETISGILGSTQKFSNWVAEGGLRRKISVVFTLIVIGIIAAISAASLNPRAAVDFVTSVTGNDVEQAIADEQERVEGERTDMLICRAVERLRVRQSAARGVTRAFAYRNGQMEQIIGVEDVCETNDQLAISLGTENAELPIGAIENTVNYMVKDPHNLKCIVSNREDLLDPGLIEWMERAELNSSVACPVADLSGTPLGLLAVSLRRPIEDAPNLERDVRDVSQRISGYWSRSIRVKEAIARIEARQ